MASTITRRGLLSAGLLGAATVLAGCRGRAKNSRQEPTDSLSNSVIHDVGFERGEMVIELRDDHAVSQLNLIGPDGSTVRQADVPSGETTSHLQVLDIRPGLGGYEHYEPGEYELVAVQANGSSTLDLELEPSLRITDVQQYRDGERNTDYGKLAVTVENVGSGPTWVYAISYRDAPNHLVNDPLNIDPGVPQLSRPISMKELILEPGRKQRYVGETTPLVFTDQGDQSCRGSSRFTVLVGSPEREALEQPVAASVEGEVRSTGLTGEYTCTDISVDRVEQEETDE